MGLTGINWFNVFISFSLILPKKRLICNQFHNAHLKLLGMSQTLPTFFYKELVCQLQRRLVPSVLVQNDKALNVCQIIQNSCSIFKNLDPCQFKPQLEPFFPLCDTSQLFWKSRGPFGIKRMLQGLSLVKIGCPPREKRLILNTFLFRNGCSADDQQDTLGQRNDFLGLVVM